MKAFYGGIIGLGSGVFFGGLGDALGIDFGLAVPIGAAVALSGLGLFAWGEE